MPAVFACEISPLEFELFYLPVRFCGRLLLPSQLADLLCASSSATPTMVDSIQCARNLEFDVHNDVIVPSHRGYYQTCDKLFNDLFVEITSKFDALHLCTLERAQINDLSSWLSMGKDNFDLEAPKFCDALAIHYKKPLLNIPARCDGCA